VPYDPERWHDFATSFAGETGIPLVSLGITHDNPQSAEAIFAAREDLIIEAESLNLTNGKALRNVGLLVMAIARNTSIDKLDDGARTLMPKFRRPDRPSIASQSDAMLKQATAVPWLVETEVFLEELGYDEATRSRLINEKMKADGRRTLEAALAYAGRAAGG